MGDQSTGPNGIPVLSCNRIGHEANPEPSDKIERAGAGITYWGHSFVTGPQGEFLAVTSENKEEIIYAHVDLSHGENVRHIWPFMRDRRIDHYQDLLKIYRDE